MAVKFINNEAPVKKGYVLQMETERLIALVYYDKVNGIVVPKIIKEITFDELSYCFEEKQFRELVGVPKEKIYIRKDLKRYIKFL